MQKMEMCLLLLKIAVEFVVVFVEAIGSVIIHNDSALSRYPNYAVPYVPFVGLLP
ncbi:hypothetical protein CDL12_19143 [Handroanthus impetiginosus]|uniref:Uncharacterized protein n=1 Tax=Handroanthus impetiginosus TaxID=429701 RepID=A0A2G9GTD6_9LAMI|nr:hypothetical protein CDL12_19143 [Handroanthus impetiginosus]